MMFKLVPTHNHLMLYNQLLTQHHCIQYWVVDMQFNLVVMHSPLKFMKFNLLVRYSKVHMHSKHQGHKIHITSFLSMAHSTFLLKLEVKQY